MERPRQVVVEVASASIQEVSQEATAVRVVVAAETAAPFITAVPALQEAMPVEVPTVVKTARQVVVVEQELEVAELAELLQVVVVWDSPLRSQDLQYFMQAVAVAATTRAVLRVPAGTAAAAQELKQQMEQAEPRTREVVEAVEVEPDRHTTAATAARAL